jgi:DNA (cytosine-5)-methyltransferase 1
MKILNLYACLGGNRYKWGNEHDITAVEWDKELARMYQERFPGDKVIVADAHKYLLDHYKEFDFIWSSPPCPSHSRARFWSSKGNDNYKEIYPEMTLYQEIIFLDNFFDGKYVVENVIPYYTPLIEAQKRGRHLYWTNFVLPNILSSRNFKISAEKNEFSQLCKFHEIDISKYKGSQSKSKIARNLVDYEAGKIILDTALGITKKMNVNQLELVV